MNTKPKDFDAVLFFKDCVICEIGALLDNQAVVHWASGAAAIYSVANLGRFLRYIKTEKNVSFVGLSPVLWKANSIRNGF